LIHVDRILSGTLEAVEETGAKLRQGFSGPMRRASAVVTGIRVGLDLLRSRRAPRRPEEQHEEELFI